MPLYHSRGSFFVVQWLHFVVTILVVVNGYSSGFLSCRESLNWFCDGYSQVSMLWIIRAMQTSMPAIMECNLVLYRKPFPLECAHLNHYFSFIHLKRDQHDNYTNQKPKSHSHSITGKAKQVK